MSLLKQAVCAGGGGRGGWGARNIKCEVTASSESNNFLHLHVTTYAG